MALYILYQWICFNWQGGDKEARNKGLDECEEELKKLLEVLKSSLSKEENDLLLKTSFEKVINDIN